MNLKDKFTNWINVSDDNYVESTENEYIDDFDFQPQQSEPAPTPTKSVFHIKNEKSSNVVNFNTPKATPASKPKVVLQKVSRFEEVYKVADILKEKRIVVLNLEACPNDISQRIIDILYGVAYANNGSFEKIAGRAYIITPDSVPVSGELEEQIQSGSEE